MKLTSPRSLTITLAGAKRPSSSRSNSAASAVLARSGAAEAAPGENSDGAGGANAPPVRWKIFAFVSMTSKWSRNSPMLSDDPRNSSPSGFRA